MKFSPTIHKIISVFLIALFALSITPVIVLHKLAANHHDISYADKTKKGDQLSKAGINCNCIDFVAEARFLNGFTVFELKIPLPVAAIKNNYAEAVFLKDHFFTPLRGPPVTA